MNPIAPVSIDSPEVYVQSSGVLSLALMDSRNHCLFLAQAVLDALSKMPHSGQASGRVRSLMGHMAWHSEWWVLRHTQRGLGAAAPEGSIRLASIEPQSDTWWHSVSTSMDAPDWAATKAYMLECHEGLLELLDKLPLAQQSSNAALYFFRQTLAHEDACSERLLRWANAWGAPLAAGVVAPQLPPAPPRERIRVRAGTARVGLAGGGFARAHDGPSHEVQVADFEIDAQPINWAQFVEFVDDGGYDRPELWQAQGWAWLETADGGQRRAPRGVTQIGVAGGVVMQNVFGRMQRRSAASAVQHVSWWEADAWCRWAGRRLPTDAEWARAVQTTARQGFAWGQVWEWTLTPFAPYPGHVTPPWRSSAERALVEGGCHTVRGASWATRLRGKNADARHFAPPFRDDGFAGFRSVSPS